MLMKRATAISLLFLVGHVAAAGCGSSGGGKTSGTAGNGAAGSTGGSGTMGSAGATAGATGSAGTAGAAGASGTAGVTGTAGADAGAGAGGTAGATGTGGADAGAGTAGAGGADATGAGGATAMTFFVTSNKSMTGNLGGLTGADKRCQDLAMAAGQGGRTWHAYVSVAMGPAGTAVNAKDRIGAGPWYNSKGALVAANLTELHAPTKSGNYMLFIDEKGQPINGHWTGTPTPVEHDILTGSSSDGTLKANETCKDWTSAAHADKAWVGHSDGLGLNAATTPPNNSWNSAHENGGCDDTAPLGGAGRLYCFAVD
jgi:hypothetical protein